MNYYEVAKLIPQKYRELILKNNLIFKAVVDFEDNDMMQLFYFYSNFIEEGNEMYAYEVINGKITTKQSCLVCLRGVLDKFKLLEPYLILLQKESNLLQNL